MASLLTTAIRLYDPHSRAMRNAIERVTGRHERLGTVDRVLYLMYEGHLQRAEFGPMGKFPGFTMILLEPDHTGMSSVRVEVA